MSNSVNDASMSSSKKKRIERQKKHDSEKRKKVLSKTIFICIGVVAAAVVCFFVVRGLYKAITKVKPSDDFSAGLAENGFIDGVKAADYVTGLDYKNMKLAKADVEYTDEELQEEIDSILDAHKELKDDASLEIKDGDTVNIDYVGTVDGEEFDGGNSNGAGYDLEIGSGSFVDNFEEQLIGAHPGDSVTVKVTFPDDYSSEELQCKAAEFAVDVHGIYELREFNDEFVAEFLSDEASTAEEYKQQVRDTNYEENLETAIEDKITELAVVNKYPGYLKHYKSLQLYQDQETYEQMNQMYQAYYGSGFSSFNEYTGMTDEEYEEDLDTRAKQQLTEKLAYQYVLESEGESLTEQDYRDYLNDTYGNEDEFDSDVEEYGLPYLLSEQLRPRAVEIIKKYVTVE